jgi:hypothetical protein
MVVPAGVDAARDLDLERPHLVLDLELLEAVAICWAMGIDRAVASAQ